MSKLNTIIESASAGLRSSYAKAVIAGCQLWSGADLKGAAKRWGGSYARQRTIASTALVAAGGYIAAVNNGKLVTACYVGMDDYGNAIHATTDGIAVQHSAKQARIA